LFSYYFFFVLLLIEGVVCCGCGLLSFCLFVAFCLLVCWLVVWSLVAMKEPIITIEGEEDVENNEDESWDDQVKREAHTDPLERQKIRNRLSVFFKNRPDFSSLMEQNIVIDGGNVLIRFLSSNNLNNLHHCRGFKGATETKA
jgi:hypothetical protein